MTFDRTRKFALMLRLSLLACVVLTAGCAASPGGMTLFPTGHRLTPSAERLRNYAPVPAPLPRELQKTVIPAYIIEPGDGLLIEPVTFDSPLRFPMDQVVLSDGTIDLGRYGRPIVAGQTVEQIEGIVQAAVEAVEDEPGPVNVRLINPQSKVYYVVGEVHAPGAYPFIGRETVLDAIIAAGGLNDRAAPCDIILSRPTPPDGCRVVLPVCYDQIVQVGDTSTNYQIMPGDRVFVATRSCREGLFSRKHRECPHCCRAQCVCRDVGCAILYNDVIYSPPAMSFEPGMLPPAPNAGQERAVPVEE